jgi:predicted dehydrogenase
MPGRRLRIAVLGCGSIGRRHLRNLHGLGARQLLAFDPSPEARAAAVAETPVPSCGTLEEVWEWQPEVVLITAPPRSHVHLALAAAERGCHLFIEKPLSHSPAGVDELAAAVARRGVVAMVACNMRFHPGPAQVKTLLQAGAIGEVIAARIESGSYLPQWRPHTDYTRSYSASAAGGGAILDCIHEIDLALWYFGPGETVAAAAIPARGIGLDVEGLAEILLRHDSGVLSSVHLNFVQRDYRRGCTVVGTDGTIYWDFNTGAVRHVRADGTRREMAQPTTWTVNDMYVAEITNFLHCVETREAPCCGIGDGLAALRVALAAREAATPWPSAASAAALPAAHDDLAAATRAR